MTIFATHTPVRKAPSFSKAQDAAMVWHADEMTTIAAYNLGLTEEQLAAHWIDTYQNLAANSDLLAKMVEAHALFEQGYKISSMQVMLEHSMPDEAPEVPVPSEVRWERPSATKRAFSAALLSLAIPLNLQGTISFSNLFSGPSFAHTSGLDPRKNEPELPQEPIRTELAPDKEWHKKHKRKRPESGTIVLG